MLRIPARLIVSKAYSVHLSFVHFEMGSPYGSSVVFLPLDRNEVLLDNWSVFLQDGVTLFGSDSDDLILIEELLQLGSWKCFFRTVLGMFGRPVVVRLALKLEGVLHIQLSSLLVQTLSVSLSPTKEWVLAFILLALLPLTLPLGVRSASAV